MGHRITEPRQQFAVVAEDIAIVQRHHARLFAGQHVTKAGPDVPPFAGGPDDQVGVLELAVELLQPRSVEPEQRRLLWQLGEKAYRPFPFAGTGLVHTDDDLLQISDVLEFAEDDLERL